MTPEKTTAKELRARVCVCGHKAYAHWHGRPEDASSYGVCAECNKCQKFTEAALLPALPEESPK